MVNEEKKKVRLLIALILFHETTKEMTFTLWLAPRRMIILRFY